MGLQCIVYMGEIDIKPGLNVARMKMLGAEVRPALSGSKTQKTTKKLFATESVDTITLSSVL
jgi:tryptophan synthase beta subunit